MAQESERRQKIDFYTKEYGMPAELAGRIVDAQQRAREILGKLGTATCRADVEKAYGEYSSLFFELEEKDRAVADFLGKKLASEMHMLSRTLQAEKGSVEPEGLSLALWEIAHREAPMKSGGRLETAEDLAKRLDNQKSKAKNKG